MPVFRSLFADIGDEQSIEASLSTFSAHITNIASMDRSLQVPALVLLDEVGSGTDPVEGGALGVAIVDHFRRRGATVVATSHYDSLKTYASTTEGVASAAFGFLPDTFAPTYQLVYGTPGRSLALEIAGRLGLNADVIAAARRNVSARDAQLAEHLAKIDQDLRAIEHEQRLVARERETLAAAESRMRQREEALKQREETYRKRLTDELEAEVRKARREIDGVIDELKVKTERLADDSPRLVMSTGDTGSARSEARAAVDAIARRVVEPVAPQSDAPLLHPGSPSRGRPSRRWGFGSRGRGHFNPRWFSGSRRPGKRMRAPVRDVKVIGGQKPTAKVSVHVELQPRVAAPARSECHWMYRG